MAGGWLGGITVEEERRTVNTPPEWEFLFSELSVFCDESLLPTSGQITNNYAGTSASIYAMIGNQPISYQSIVSAASMTNISGIGERC